VLAVVSTSDPPIGTYDSSGYGSGHKIKPTTGHRFLVSTFYIHGHAFRLPNSSASVPVAI